MITKNPNNNSQQTRPTLNQRWSIIHFVAMGSFTKYVYIKEGGFINSQIAHIRDQGNKLVSKNFANFSFFEMEITFVT